MIITNRNLTMIQREAIQLEWWRIACEENPDPISFVDISDKFIFCNNAWCELVGWSETELKEKRWQDITKVSDIGSDESELTLIKNGNKQEYYLEKTYIRRDGKEIDISLYVHRYPEYGELKGYVVFAKRLSSKEYTDLRAKFFDLHKTVLMLQQSAISFDSVMSQISNIQRDVDNHREILNSYIGKSNINIGDNIGGDRTGRDKISNEKTILIVLAIVVGILTLGFVALVAGGKINLQSNYGQVEVEKK